jgi:CDP-diacylglycerol--glycerol-3-phosphate 3-phosphatidyltransferase
LVVGYAAPRALRSEFWLSALVLYDERPFKEKAKYITIPLLLHCQQLLFSVVMSREALNLTLANRITIVRILSVPFFILLLMYYGISARDGHPNEILRWTATFCYFATFLSDALDGYIARTRKQITKLGSVLDPLADKALLLSGLILLSRHSSGFEYILPLWFILLVISRDTVLVLGSLVIYYITNDVTVKPRIAGKAATFFQMITIAWMLLEFPTNRIWIILGAAAMCTAISAAQYIIDGIRQIDKGQKEAVRA